MIGSSTPGVTRAARLRICASVTAAAAVVIAWLATPTGPKADSPYFATVVLQRGETLDAAARRAGVGPSEAITASRLLETAGREPASGSALRAVVAMRSTGPRLLSLSIKPSDGNPLVIDRAYDGGLRLRPRSARSPMMVTVADEKIEGSLFDTAGRAGADPALINQATTLLAARLDFARDVRPGDRLRLVFTRRINAAGDTEETGLLLYAEVIGPKGGERLYAFDQDGRTDFLDSEGRSARTQLLRTPVIGARITSSFGMRSHPIFGYTLMHQGVDFAAPLGTPVLAAGDGVVEEARSWAGYGNWLRIRHGGGWETGYAHLASYATGLKAGNAVRQGDVVGYVGQTGLATGPHLHYETWLAGRRVDPARAAFAATLELDPCALADFAAQRARIDRLLALSRGSSPATEGSPPSALASSSGPGRAGLRLSHL
jgi:murein DD-endopeptidase MepM/ murein hydrolase activator NlpD